MNYEPIAIVGMACRFPAAQNVAAFWRLLCEGRDGVREAPRGRFCAERFFDEDPEAPGRTHVRRAGFLDDVAGFDWRAFRIAPKEATAIDPQHRLLLEIAWEALEDAGVTLEEAASGATGVFVGIVWNDFLRLQARNWAALDGYAAAGSPLAFAANRISYHFNLRGPSLALDGTCASSLMSVHQACLSLALGESSMALAGGVNLILSPDSMIVMAKAGVLSPDAKCKTLDARADGFARGEGAGLVVLKRLADVRPEDRVYAVIRGTAVNHNGRNEWIMAPSPGAQAGAIRAAYERAGIAPRDASYVELHGTGFARGDALEASALSEALGANERRPEDACSVGAVKTNIGNLEAAAGIAGVIKVALCLWHKALPPTLNLRDVNPAIDLGALGLAPQRTLQAWPEGRPLVAGVSVTSFSGNNGHAVLTAHRPEVRGEGGAEGPALLALSARSAEALVALARTYAEWLRGPGRGERLADICYTAAQRRTHHPHRFAAIGGDHEGLARELEAFAAAREAGEARPQSSRAGAAGGAGAGGALAEAARRYSGGGAAAWGELLPKGRCVSLPPYPWLRERLWPEALTPEAVSTPPEAHAQTASAQRPGGAEVEGPTAFVEQLSALPEVERARFAVERLRSALRSVLGLPDDAKLDASQPLFLLGITSLSLLEFRTRVQALLGRPLVATSLFDFPTLDALAGHLVDRVMGPREAPPPSTRRSAGLRRHALAVASISEEEAESRLLKELEALKGLS